MREWGGGPCAASISCESDMTERGHGGLAAGFMGGLLTRSIKVHLPGIQGGKEKGTLEQGWGPSHIRRPDTVEMAVPRAPDDL